MSTKFISRLSLCVISGIVSLSANDPLYCPAPTSAYLFNNDIVAVEAEDLDEATNWVFESASPTGFTGRGYVRYTGSRQTCPSELGEEWKGVDKDGRCIAPHDEWLKIPVRIDVGGSYSVNVRGAHTQDPTGTNEDFISDATMWIHATDYQLPIRMSHLGSSNDGLSTVNMWVWCSYGPLYEARPADMLPNPFNIRFPGIYTFYIGGREPGTKIDRISIYRLLGPNQFPAGYMDPATPVSEKITLVDETALAPRSQPAQYHAEYRKTTCGSLSRMQALSPATVAFDLRGRAVSRTGFDTMNGNGILIIGAVK